MNEPTLTRPDFLALSTRLCDDLRRWLSEAVPHHSLTPDQLIILDQAAQVVDEVTIALATRKGIDVSSQ